MNSIFHFLQQLQENNNREWFNANKHYYLDIKKQVDDIFEKSIAGISKFDKRISHATVKECVFRIYRDVRFSHDKRPYKEQFSGFISYPNGWKSKYAGYYIHLDNENSHVSAGVWRPEPAMLKKLRQSVIDNHDELNEIRLEKKFAESFGNNFYDNDMLKNIPTGFPKDFQEPYLLKLKHYIVNSSVGNVKEMTQNEFVDLVVELAKIAYPFVQFINYSIDE